MFLNIMSIIRSLGGISLLIAMVVASFPVEAVTLKSGYSPSKLVPENAIKIDMTDANAKIGKSLLMLERDASLRDYLEYNQSNVIPDLFLNQIRAGIMDLDLDGTPEIIVQVNHVYFCIGDNCRTFVFKSKDGKNWFPIMKQNMVRTIYAVPNMEKQTVDLLSASELFSLENGEYQIVTGITARDKKHVFEPLHETSNIQTRDIVKLLLQRDFAAQAEMAKDYSQNRENWDTVSFATTNINGDEQLEVLIRLDHKYFGRRFQEVDEGEVAVLMYVDVNQPPYYIFGVPERSILIETERSASVPISSLVFVSETSGDFVRYVFDYELNKYKKLHKLPIQDVIWRKVLCRKEN